jgi:hypothetical protein
VFFQVADGCRQRVHLHTLNIKNFTPNFVYVRNPFNFEIQSAFK